MRQDGAHWGKILINSLVGCGFKSRDTRKNFHFKLITRKLFQTSYASSSWLVSFIWKLYLISFLYYLTFISKLLHLSHWSWKLYLTSFLAIFPLSLSESYPICLPLWLVENHRTSFYFLLSNTLTHSMAVLLGKVDSVQCKELGRQTGGEEVGNKKMINSSQRSCPTTNIALPMRLSNHLHWLINYGIT